MKHSTVARTAIALSCLSLLIAIAGLFISDGSKAESTEQWIPLSKLVSTQQLTQIVADNTAPSADRAEIAKSAIGISKGDLLVVDFETAALCGRGGCAISAYRLSTNEQILFTYARQAAGEPIVELIDPRCRSPLPADRTPYQQTCTRIDERYAVLPRWHVGHRNAVSTS